MTPFFSQQGQQREFRNRNKITSSKNITSYKYIIIFGNDDFIL